jgi:hypothetical protein
VKVDRRTTLQWMLAAGASVPALQAGFAAVPEELARAVAAGQRGYGTDPELTREWQAGGPWPLTLTDAGRLTVRALCDLIIPADEHSPAASAVGVVDFIDEWISAPYPQQRADRDLLLPGLRWIDDESRRRFGQPFHAVSDAQRARVADDICAPARAAPELAAAAKFFARFRDLTAGGFYTTPEGMKDIGYRGNVPLASFDGPPLAALKQAGLA